MLEANISTGKKKILLIDDERKLLLGLRAVMAREGFEVLAGSDGNEGVKLAKENLPDIIICDVMMPPPNGFELKKILAAEPLTATIPFIFLTARTAEVDKIAGLKQGADDYITKPFNIDELIARVHTILRRIEIGRRSVLQEMDEKNARLEQLYATAQAQAVTDPLTGLYNRRGFFEVGEIEILRAKRYRHPLTAIMFDLDYFKKINDTHGHATGDIVLKEIANRSLQQLRKIDIAGRIGGDEFSILLPETKALDANIVAQRLLAVANLPIDIGKRTLTTSISIGLTDLDDDIANLQEFLNKADRFLYKAKEAGRNRLCISQ